MAYSSDILVTRTARDTQERLTTVESLQLGAQPGYNVPSILVDPTVTYQTLEGFGGAFTEAAAVTFNKMNAEAQAIILRAYFDPQDGIGYSIGRTHINSCDFSLGNYAYNDTPGDLELRQFSMEREFDTTIALLKAANKTAGKPLKLLATPWSPPAWMKSNGAMNGGGKLLPQYRQTWARYYCRYAKAMAALALPLWGLTVQNEAEATQTWDSCIYTAEEERDFVRDYLGPELHAQGLADVRLMIWDHNRDRLFERASIVYDDPQAAQYVWGAAFHWYVGDFFENVQRTHEAYPDKHLFFTEGCQEGGPHTGEWGLGERYARSMIQDLNHWTDGWVDWNILLDERGGPNHVGNFCSAPILADTRLGDASGVLLQSSYYYIGHISKFFKPGGKRILAVPTLDQLETTACQNPDGSLSVVVMNRTDELIDFALKADGRAALTTAPAHSITTYTLSAA